MEKIIKKLLKEIEGSLFKTLLLISFIIGGGIQSIYLLLLGIGYLRFFSISQLTQDTITLVIPISIIYIIIKIISFLSQVNAKTLGYKDRKSYLLSFFSIIHIVLFGIFLLIDNNIYYYLFETFKEGEDLLIIVFCFFLIYTLFYIIIHLFEKFLHKFKNNTIIFLSILFITLYFIVYIISFFNNNILIPNNLVNTKYICNDELNDKNCKIRYFNDKYIFIEREDNKIEILDFQSLFKKNK